MTLTEAQTQFNALADRLSATKAAQKAALAALGRTPTDVWDTYPDELRAVTGGTGNYQESKTVTADPAGMTILPDEGYSGMLKAIIAAEPNFQPWNLVDGIEAWGITGTAKPATTSDAPTNLPVSKDDADTAYETETGAAPTETDYFVCVDNDGNITYWYLSDDFTITSYDPITTEFKATGAIRMAYHTTGESVGTWTLDDFTSAESGGWNYLKNIRSCTREKLYYTIDGTAYEVWPNSAWDAANKWSYNGTVLPKLPEWDNETYPYVCMVYTQGVFGFGAGWNLYMFQSPLHLYSHEGDANNLYLIPAETSYLKSFALEKDVDAGTGKFKTVEHMVLEEDLSCDVNNLVWSNYNLLNTDGTVSLAASKPVPVYE